MLDQKTPQQDRSHRMVTSHHFWYHHVLIFIFFQKFSKVKELGDEELPLLTNRVAVEKLYGGAEDGVKHALM